MKNSITIQFRNDEDCAFAERMIAQARARTASGETGTPLQGGFRVHPALRDRPGDQSQKSLAPDRIEKHSIWVPLRELRQSHTPARLLPEGRAWRVNNP